MKTRAVVFEESGPSAPRRGSFDFASPADLDSAHKECPGPRVWVVPGAFVEELCADAAWAEAVEDRGRYHGKGLKAYFAPCDFKKVPALWARYEQPARLAGAVRRLVESLAKLDRRGFCLIGVEGTCRLKGGKNKKEEIVPVFEALFDLAEGPEPAEEEGLNLDVEVPDSVEQSLKGRSGAMKRLRKLVALSARSSFPVLVLGDSGTGKELVARQIHEAGGRAGSFIVVNCASIPEHLLESELFGMEANYLHARSPRKIGLWEKADNGTLFLDEFGELLPAHQAKILRVLEDGTFYRVGGVQMIKARARVVAATNRDLFSMAQNGEFREDLLNRMTLFLYTPKLSDHPEDIPAIARHHWRKITGQRASFSPELLSALQEASWPQNVRGIKNILRVMHTFYPHESRLDVRHLRFAMEYTDQARRTASGNRDAATVSEHRNQCLRHLKRTHGAVNAAFHTGRRAFLEGGSRGLPPDFEQMRLFHQELSELGREPLLFHGHDTCSAVKKFQRKIRYFLDVWAKDSRQAAELWEREMDSAFRDIRDILFGEIERLID